MNNMNNYSILLFEYSWSDIDFQKNNVSGTSFISKLLMKEYQDKYDVYYCVPVNVILDDELTNINVLKYDAEDFIDKCLNIHNIKLIINTHNNIHPIIEQLKKTINSKYLFIKHFYSFACGYNQQVYDMYDKIITVIDDISDNENKIFFINNPYNQIYNNIDISSLSKDHSIICTYGNTRTNGNWDYLLNTIFPNVKKRIHDVKIKFCYPNYDGISIHNSDDFIKYGSLSENELKNKLLETPVSFRTYDINEASPIGQLHEILCGCFTISSFKDGMRNNVTDEFYTKYSTKDKSDDEIVSLICDVILNYDNYVNDLIKNQVWLYSNRSVTQIMNKYKNIINNLIHNDNK